MSPDERREKIIQEIMQADQPISASALAKCFRVSRQVIVQDIALLRAADYPVLSTPKGYLYQPSTGVKRRFIVSHTDEEIEDEMNLIVDLGGRILDVFIHHELYGNFTADLSVFSRRQVKDFMDKLQRGESKPLKNLTSGVHGHTVEADNADILDQIEQALSEKGYLMDRDRYETNAGQKV